MANTILRTPNGNIQAAPGGTIEVSAGGTASSCSNGWPEMYFTIFKSGYVGGSISFAGQTWTQAEIAAGTKKGPICPTNYNSQYYIPAFTPTTCFGGRRERWTHNIDWTMRAGWKGPFTAFGNANYYHYIRIGQIPSVNFFASRFGAVRTYTSPGFACTPNAPTVVSGPFSSSNLSGLQLTSPIGLGPFFTKATFANTTTNACGFGLSALRVDGYIRPVLRYGSMTDVNGIVYTWEPGNGW